MGMTIDDSRERAPMSREEVVETLKTMVFGVQAFKRFNAKERETLDKAWNIINQYDNRLKADLVAMLTEIQMEIEESDNCGKAFHLGLQMASNIIQQKINALKENSCGNNKRED